MAKYLQGIYKVQNPHKYVGNPNQVVFRSSWEYKFYKKLDTDDRILKWNSERTIIPYQHPVKGTWHRYFVDATMQCRNAAGELKTYLVEIKPMKQTMPPKKPKRLTESYAKSVDTFLVNQAKWEAAREFAKKHNIEFVVITEEQLFGKTK